MNLSEPALASLKPHESLLPTTARTRGGAVFDPTAERWAYRDGVNNVNINFSAVSTFSDELQRSCKATLLWYAENWSADHLTNMHRRVVHFVRFISNRSVSRIDTIDGAALLNYKSSLSGNVAWYLGALSGFLKKWHRLGFPGVSNDAVELLGELRIAGNAKGVAVLTMDPVRGPFTNIEQEAIQGALDDAYAEGSIDEGLYLLAWLFMALGQRPTQFAALKVCDLSRTISTRGEVQYVVKVPRAKQRNADIRGEFKERSLIPQIGEPLYAYAQKIRATFAGILADPYQAPLFPQRRDEDLETTSTYQYHCTAKSMSDALREVLNALRVPSERTGEPLNITPVRFRRTFGTRAAQEGHGELVIAELLDHADTQNVGVYVAAIPEMVARIDTALAMQLAPLAQAFAGTLIPNESAATRADDRSSRIVDLRVDRRKPMGSCGQHSFCSFNAPIACYTCRSVEPWLDGPHEALLARLIGEREKLLVTTDPRIATTNDRTILAVAQVIQLCQEARAEGAANG